jgi:nucleoside-diphosphate-sugar epimerase
VLLTGSTGFLGSVLRRKLEQSSNNSITCVVRKRTQDIAQCSIEIGNINGTTDYSEVLIGKEFVIHAAARAHIMKDEVDNPLLEYRDVNVLGSENLARQAAAAGVKRFIFISSVKVSGESTTGGKPFREGAAPVPEDPYGQSKYEAEESLKRIAAATGMELVIIRPPLVYGPGVKANFLSLIKLAATGFPLPFGSINNSRSMIYVGNLVEFIIRCIVHPKAANQTFLISDGQDVSLRYLISLIRSEFGCSPRLLSIPIVLFKLVGICTGKKHLMDRLVGNLQIDSSKARKLLGWMPPYTVEEGIAATVQDFKNRNK